MHWRPGSSPRCSRRQARDLFDSHWILQMENLDSHSLGSGFVVYGAMNGKDRRTVSLGDVDFDAMDLARQFVPTLRVNATEVQWESKKLLVDPHFREDDAMRGHQPNS